MTAKTRRVYQEGGWGWMAVGCASLAELVIYGGLKSLGILITSMKEDFHTNLWIIVSTCALHIGVQFLLTPFATALACKYESRGIITIGGILYGCGLVMSSVVHHIAPFALFIVILAGSGAACTLETTRAEVAFYFQEKYALASFLALAGGPIGMLLYGPLTQVFSDTYGWRGALLLVGGMGFHLTWAGLLVRRPTGASGRRLLADDCGDPDNGSSSEWTDSRWGRMGKAITETLGLDLFLCLDFLLIAAVRLLSNVSYGGILVFMDPNAQDIGLSPGETALMSIVFGLGSLVGLGLTALVLHTGLLSCHAAGAISGCLTVVAFPLAPYVTTPVWHVANIGVIGAGVHSIIQVTSVLSRELPYGDCRFVVVLGWQSFLSGMSTSGGNTLSGWLFEVTQSFHATFFMYSAFMAATVLVLLVDYLRVCTIRRRVPTL